MVPMLIKITIMLLHRTQPGVVYFSLEYIFYSDIWWGIVEYFVNKLATNVNLQIHFAHHNFRNDQTTRGEAQPTPQNWF